MIWLGRDRTANTWVPKQLLRTNCRGTTPQWGVCFDSSPPVIVRCELAVSLLELTSRAVTWLSLLALPELTIRPFSFGLMALHKTGSRCSFRLTLPFLSRVWPGGKPVMATHTAGAQGSRRGLAERKMLLGLPGGGGGSGVVEREVSGCRGHSNTEF